MGFGKATPTKKELRDAQNEEADSLFKTLSGVVSATQHKDTIVTAKLSSVVPDPNNGRLGQTELLDNLNAVIECIEAQGGEDVPLYDQLKGAPALSLAAKWLYDNCAGLANSYIANGGYADTPPKVLPADDNGLHGVKTGHRRYIAYRLAEPFTEVDQIDVILDKNQDSEDELYRTIGRITENTERENNTLAEELLEISRVITLLKERNEKINKAKLARQTGLERTKLSRLVDIVEAGGAEDYDTILSIHESGVEDVTALSLLFKAPKDQWSNRIEEISTIGPSAFRAKYSASSGKSVAVPHSERETEGVKPEQDHQVTSATQPSSEDFTGGGGASESSASPKASKPSATASRPRPPAVSITEQSHGAGISKLFELLEEANPGLTEQATGSSETERLMNLLKHLSAELKA